MNKWMNTLALILSQRPCLSLSQLTEVVFLLSLPLATVLHLLSFIDEGMGKAISQFLPHLSITFSMHYNAFHSHHCTNCLCQSMDKPTTLSSWFLCNIWTHQLETFVLTSVTSTLWFPSHVADYSSSSVLLYSVLTHWYPQTVLSLFPL